MSSLSFVIPAVLAQVQKRRGAAAGDFDPPDPRKFDPKLLPAALLPGQNGASLALKGRDLNSPANRFDPRYVDAQRRYKESKPGTLPHAMAHVEMVYDLGEKDRQAVKDYFFLRSQGGAVDQRDVDDAIARIGVGKLWTIRSANEANRPKPPSIALPKKPEIDWQPSATDDPKRQAELDRRWNQMFRYTRQDFFDALNNPWTSEVRYREAPIGFSLAKAIPEVERKLGKRYDQATEPPWKYEQRYFDSLGYKPQLGNPNRGKGLADHMLDLYSDATGIPKEELPYVRETFKFLEGLAYSPVTLGMATHKAISEPSSIPGLIQEFGRSVNVLEPGIEGPERFGRFLNLLATAVGEEKGPAVLESFVRSPKGVKLAQSLRVPKERVAGYMKSAYETSKNLWRERQASGAIRRTVESGIKAESKKPAGIPSEANPGTAWAQGGNEKYFPSFLREAAALQKPPVRPSVFKFQPEPAAGVNLRSPDVQFPLARAAKNPVTYQATQVPFHPDIKQMRLNARQYMLNNWRHSTPGDPTSPAPTVDVPALGSKVSLGGDNIGKMGSGDRAKIAMIPAIPKLLETAQYVGSYADKHGLGGLRGVHRLVNRMEMDGVLYDVLMTVREDMQSNRFIYDHAYTIVKRLP